MDAVGLNEFRLVCYYPNPLGGATPYGTDMISYRVDFFYMGLPGHAAVNLSRCLIEDPYFNIPEILSYLILPSLRGK